MIEYSLKILTFLYIKHWKRYSFQCLGLQPRELLLLIYEPFLKGYNSFSIWKNHNPLHPYFWIMKSYKAKQILATIPIAQSIFSLVQQAQKGKGSYRKAL